MGGGGPSNTTQTTTSSLPPWAAQVGKDLLGAAEPYYLGNLTMPSNLNQQVQGFTPDQLAAFSNIEGLSPGATGVAQSGMSYLSNVLGNNPATMIGSPGAVSPGMISGGGPTMSAQESALIDSTMGGAYLNPSTNPYITATYNEAAKGVTDQYNTSIAPSLMAEGEAAAGGGPGSLAGGSGFNQAQWQNQYGLGQNLNNLATNIYGGNYAQERQNQMTAAGMSQQATEAQRANELAAAEANQQTGLAGQEFNVGTNLQTELANQQAGLQGVGDQLQALGLLPQTQSSLYAPANELLASGTMQQQQGQTQLDTLFQNALRSAEWPQSMFAGLASLIGPATGNSGTTVTTGPNPFAVK